MATNLIYNLPKAEILAQLAEEMGVGFSSTVLIWVILTTRLPSPKPLKRNGGENDLKPQR